MNEDIFFNGEKNSKKKNSKKQERMVSKEVQGKITKGSGNMHYDKTDVKTDSFRIECKRTDKKSISLKKDWLKKLRLQAGNDLPVLHIQIQDENWYLVRPEEFLLLKEVNDVVDKKRC